MPKYKHLMMPQYLNQYLRELWQELVLSDSKNTTSFSLKPDFQKSSKYGFGAVFVSLSRPVLTSATDVPAECWSKQTHSWNMRKGAKIQTIILIDVNFGVFEVPRPLAYIFNN